MDKQEELNVGALSSKILLHIVREYLTVEDEENFGLVCRAWQQLREDHRMWAGMTLGQLFQGSSLSRRAFRFFGVRSKGTEGHCCKVQFRGDDLIYAMKKARVYPKGEGVPYYMLREIEFLRGLEHPNVSMLKAVALSGSELFMFFPYAPRTLHEALNTPNEPHESGAPLPLHIAKRFLYQILQGVCACHERGVLHRNIKPKHLLLYDYSNPSSSLYPLPINWEKDAPLNHADLETCTVCLSDFALVRTSLQPLRRFTPEVVTLWYRAPEVLLGGQYFTSVDMWAVGCVFAEMLCGKPFFPGVCEVNQLFEIFNKLGTPNDSTWPGFSALPNVSFQFPNWPRAGLKRFFPKADRNALDLLEKILEIDPAKRLSAREALGHPFFDDEFLRKEGISVEAHRRATARTPEEEEMIQYEKARMARMFVASQQVAMSTPPPCPPSAAAAATPAGGVDAAAQSSEQATSGAVANSNPTPEEAPILPDRKMGLANPKLLSRYLPNILNVERESFESFLQGKEYPPQALSSELRFSTVRRLVDIVDLFDVSIRAEFLAVTLMDRFLAKCPKYESQHELLGTTCLHIASKCEDVSYIGVSDLISLPIAVSIEEAPKQANRLLELQEKVLNALEFRLAIPTVLDFLHGFCFTLNLDRSPHFRRLFSACLCFAEQSLLDVEFVSMRPSQTAAAILAYASLFFEPLSDDQLCELLFVRSKCPPQVFKTAFKAIARIHVHRRDTPNETLRKRYASKSGPLFTKVEKWEDYLSSKWSLLTARELPFSEASFIE